MSREENVKFRRLPRVCTLAVLPLAMLALWAPASASAEVQFGSLSNFDVFNDSGEETHGFEIELDGISSSDISYTFGAPYQHRYGTPTLENFPGGVYVRYASPYDPATKEFTSGTPLAPTPITPTMGHQCWYGSTWGEAAYLASGCEHFGLGLLKTPTKTVYHWLVKNPSKPGTLMTANTKVSVPTPEFEVKPPSVHEPAPVVKAVVKAPEPDPGQIWGDAVWVKVYETEAEQPAELNHLMTDDPFVPQELAQTETEWVLMQKENGVANAIGDVASQKALGAKQESVTRRYEIFKYTGAYDEEHEAVPAINDNTPKEGEIGEYVGAQMDAANVVAGEPAPAVGKLSVNTGPSAGATTVTISGVNFTGATAVRFGSTDAKSFKANSAKSITAESPAGTTGIVDVTVISPNGASAVVKGDTFKYGSPTVTGVTPNTGSKAGGMTVTVTGSGFTPGGALTTLKFASKAGTAVECTSSTTCTVVVPAAKKASTVDVTAKSGGKASAKAPADHFIYS